MFSRPQPKREKYQDEPGWMGRDSGRRRPIMGGGGPAVVRIYPAEAKPAASERTKSEGEPKLRLMAWLGFLQPRPTH
jgi:hypothetical protein